MKKISLFILAAIVLGSSVQAQTTVAKKKSAWGIKTGLNVSNIRVKNGMASDWKGGLAAGLFFNIKAANKFSIQPEFLYSSMGGGNAMTTATGTSLRLNYFSVPVLAKLKLANNFSVVLGPQIDVLISAKYKSSSNQFTKVTDSYRENSFNGTAGFEFWPLRSFGVTARYIYGFNNIWEGSTPDLKNQGVQIMAALKL